MSASKDPATPEDVIDLAEVATGRRVAVKLTPFERRQLSKLRMRGLPHGARPRPAARALVEAMLQWAQQLESKGEL